MSITFHELWLNSIIITLVTAVLIWLGWYANPGNGIFFCISLLLFVGVNHLAAYIHRGLDSAGNKGEVGK